MTKTLDITRILREQKEQLRAGFQDRLVMTASITLRKYDATACIILTELGEMRLGEPCSANPLRIPHPKIDKLACQAQGVGIFAIGEITLHDTYCDILLFIATYFIEASQR